MSKAINKYQSLYSILDDVAPLYQIFHADEYILKNDIKSFKKFAEQNNLTMYYNMQQPSVYSQPNNCGGYKITNPAVWNIALSILGENIKNAQYIVEFSRGNDGAYNELFDIKSKNVYQKSFECLCNNVNCELLENSIIININAPLAVRKTRNLERFKNGGHLVAEETMNSVYKEDVFVCHKNKCMTIKDVQVPVFFVKNSIKRTKKDVDSFFAQEYQKALNYYKDFKHEI